MQRRVVITGVGAVSPLGLTSDQMWQGLLEGRCGLGPIRNFDASAFDCNIAGEVPPFNIRDYVPKSHRKATKLMSRDIELAVAASHEAVKNSGLISKADEGKTPTLIPQRTAINYGAGLIACDLAEMAQSVRLCVTDGKFDIRKWGSEGMKTLTPLWLLKYLPNMLPCHVAIIHDIQGPSNTITCGDASSYLAVSEAAEMIIRGDVETALAGGGETRINPIGIARQYLMKRANCSSNDNPAAACRPFDANAAGTIFSEAAGTLVLEDMQTARNRGASMLAELVGWGASHSLNPDYTHLEPDGKAITYAIDMAMQQAGITPDKLDLIIPCGTGIPSDDKAEAIGIQNAIGASADVVPVWPTKSLLGHSGAAAGTLDMIVAALAIHTGKTGKAVNFDSPTKDCKLNLLRQPLNKPLNYVLCCGYSFGGQCAAVILKAIKD
ncbi:MAG TPA: beta-ketoacyl-[acyl-carrier-protein] synthase family protein [Anaerohalosphaeraceae bacterium]|nr:beta-ketoacyl-[acyl-carrier-protein] synthase family protein [Anaerohalosphaeraceae bacterium]